MMNLLSYCLGGLGFLILIVGWIFSFRNQENLADYLGIAEVETKWGIRFFSTFVAIVLIVFGNLA